jgi:hypothetical protein
MLTVVLLIIFIAGLGSLGINLVSAAAPTAPVALGPQGDILLCNNVLNQIKFEFSAVTGATGYTIQLSTVSDFSVLGLAFSTPYPYLLASVNLNPGTYYWRVQAYNSDGSSPWSNVLSFHVIPSPPVLVSPTANGFVLPNPIFIWDSCFPFDAQFQLSDKQDFSNLLFDLNFNSNSYVSKGPYVYEFKFYWPFYWSLPNGIYWWRVRSKAGTEVSSWSSQLFIITTPPSVAPTIISPATNVISSTEVNFKWSYINNADRYEIQINKGNSPIIDTTVYESQYTFRGEDNTVYLFRVRAGNPVGWGPWSEWRQFKILLPPNTPTLASPFNGRIIQNSNIVALTWNPIATADSYLIQIVNINTGITQTFEVLAPNTTLNFTGQWGSNYSWKVKAKNVSGESSWSTSWMFAIQENIPPRLEIDSYPQYTNQNNVSISGKVYDLESGLDALYCGSNFVPVSSDGTFKLNVALNEGANSFTLIAIDKAGNKTQKIINIVKDTIPPEINITFPIASIYPSYEGITVISDIKVTGTIKDLLPITLLINNENCFVDSYGNFAYQTNLNYGLNKIYLKAIDAAGNISEKTLIIYKTINPKFIFRINNPKMQVQVINKQGQLDWVEEEIDPGRYTVPVIVKGRVFIPIRKFIELINGTVDWDAISKKVTITVPGRGKTIELWIGKPLARVTDSYGNQKWIQIEKGDNSVAPFIKNGRSYFPLRFVAEELNAIVNWDQVLQQVIIEFPIVP